MRRLSRVSCHLPSQAPPKGIKLELILLHPFLPGDAQSFVILTRQTSPSPSRFFEAGLWHQARVR